ncbi:MAG: 6-phosphofructokinase [Pseudobutyrivibrio sp.]|nr:6-phosphofructokinase [Pseudobutyrivibrio sp.]
MAIKTILVAQSGGPTAAINSSLAGVINAGIKNGLNVLGSVHGILGVIDNTILNINELNQKENNFIKKLQITPAMYLGSCRYKLSENDYPAIFKRFEELSVDAFIYIGGNDSMDTVVKLSKYGESIHSPIRVIGVPKTVDNDLCGIDHSPGFGSAAKFVATNVRQMAYDVSIYPVKSVTIVEIMGRDAGWLTASSVLARTGSITMPQLIYLPERAFNTESFLNDVKSALEKEDHIMICISEGIHDAAGNYISATESKEDTFGHSMLNGAGKYLENLISARLGVKVRSVELNIPQRCSTHLASKVDLEEGFTLGSNAVELACAGETGLIPVLTRVSDNPYSVTYSNVKADTIANNAREVPQEWINEAGNNVTDDMITYLKPLVMGEVAVEYEDGIPAFLDIPHL